MPGSRTDPIAFAIACAMAFVAGATDVCGLSRLHDLFVSFMSGNTTMLAFALGHGNIVRAANIAALVGLFVGGAFLGTVIAVASGRRHAAVVMLVVAIMLLAAACWPAGTIVTLVLAMGVLNAAMHRAGTTGVSLTYVTGTLVKLGQGLGNAVCRHPSDPAWPLQGVLWLALLGGAAAGTLGLVSLGGGTLFLVSLLALFLSAVTAFRPERVEPERSSTGAADPRPTLP